MTIDYYFYRARYYEPGVGRFTQRDPIGLRGGINHYSYVNNNPAFFIDSFGLKCCCKSIIYHDQGTAPFLPSCAKDPNLTITGTDQLGFINDVSQLRNAYLVEVDVGGEPNDCIFTQSLSKSWTIYTQAGTETVNLSKDDTVSGCIEIKGKKIYYYDAPGFYKNEASMGPWWKRNFTMRWNFTTTVSEKDGTSPCTAQRSYRQQWGNNGVRSLLLTNCDDATLDNGREKKSRRSQGRLIIFQLLFPCSV